MDKEVVYIHTIKYYSAINCNEFESVVMRWMNLEPLIQSEVSQKEKDKYCILMHYIWYLENGTEECLQGNNGETYIENRLMDTEKRGGEGDVWRE